jgi:hypothetical protein
MSGVEGPDDQNPYKDGTQDGVEVSISWETLKNVIFPNWLSDNIPLIRNILKTGPRKWLLGGVFTVVGSILMEILGIIEFVGFGTKPNVFAGSNERIWGLLDVPVGIGELLGDAAASVILLVFEAYASVLRALIPNAGSPVVAPLAAFALVLTAFLIFRVAGPALLTTIQSLLEAIPFVGGPLSTLLGRLRS